MRHKHDCSNCKPLGEFKEYDLYFCEQGVMMPTVIARFGDNGPDYFSGLGFRSMEPLREAEMRAVKDGYILPMGAVIAGSRVRSYDFPDGREDCYVEGRVSRIEDGYAYINVDREVWKGCADETPKRPIVYAPLGVGSFSGKRAIVRI